VMWWSAVVVPCTEWMYPFTPVGWTPTVHPDEVKWTCSHRSRFVRRILRGSRRARRD
jgi:hypothetical protein